MRARILKPAETFGFGDTASEPVVIADAAVGAHRCHYWRGASGRRYLHTAYDLVDCPPIRDVAYVLARRHVNGDREILHVNTATNAHAPLNLARIRQRAATLGANEVHLHLLAATPEQRMLAVCDLRAAAFGSLEADQHAGADAT
jgi:hypothetical protein